MRVKERTLAGVWRRCAPKHTHRIERIYTLAKFCIRLSTPGEKLAKVQVAHTIVLLHLLFSLVTAHKQNENPLRKKSSSLTRIKTTLCREEEGEKKGERREQKMNSQKKCTEMNRKEIE